MVKYPQGKGQKNAALRKEISRQLGGPLIPNRILKLEGGALSRYTGKRKLRDGTLAIEVYPTDYTTKEPIRELPGEIDLKDYGTVSVSYTTVTKTEYPEPHEFEGRNAFISRY